MEDSERAVCKLESSFRIRNVGFSVVLTCIFTALYEKCDTTGQDERYQITYGKRVIHVVTTMRDHGYFSFTTRVSGIFFNQILLEVLMSCTKHFDLSSSLTASCVARFMIC